MNTSWSFDNRIIEFSTNYTLSTELLETSNRDYAFVK